MDDEDVSPQTEDLIGEAEIYIAYGRFPQAISFLQNAIQYDVTGDGGRFLVFARSEEPPIRLVLNWPAALVQ